jgi:glucokinase
VSEKSLSTDAGQPLALGIDIGGTTIKAGIVGAGGDLFETFHEASPRTTSALRKFVASVLKRAPSPVCGIGIGCKGIIDASSTRVQSSPGDLRFLEGQLLSEVVGTEVPVCAENDARTALLAEVLWGAAHGRRNVVMLTLGTGVGGAVLLDGSMLRGMGGSQVILAMLPSTLEGSSAFVATMAVWRRCFHLARSNRLIGAICTEPPRPSFRWTRLGACRTLKPFSGLPLKETNARVM